MCNYSKMIWEKAGVKISEKTGDEKRQRKTAQRMLKAGKYSYEEISELTELPVDEVKKIEEEMSVTV